MEFYANSPVWFIVKVGGKYVVLPDKLLNAVYKDIVGQVKGDFEEIEIKIEITKETVTKKKNCQISIKSWNWHWILTQRSSRFVWQKAGGESPVVRESPAANFNSVAAFSGEEVF